MSKINVAIIDLYNNEVNQGMRCIKDILTQTAKTFPTTTFHQQVFEGLL